MYNLLIAAIDDAWDGASYRFPKDRFLTYTDETVTARFRNVSDPAIREELCKLPSLFMYERPVSKSGWRGRVDDFRLTSSNVEFSFSVDQSTSIEWNALSPVLYHLGIDHNSWELKTMHWAVKDCDLDRALARVYPNLAGASTVVQPTPDTTSEIVERALADAEHLLLNRGAVSAVDRSHTALHGYLVRVTRDAGCTIPPDAGITQLFKLLRENHPAFAVPGPRQQDVQKITRNIAAILDALNPLRNLASVAHPNENLLEGPEAMLTINSIRTIFHYIDEKLTHHRLPPV